MTLNISMGDLSNAMALRLALSWLPRPAVLDTVDRMSQPMRHLLGVTCSVIMAGEQGWGVPADFGARN